MLRDFSFSAYRKLKIDNFKARFILHGDILADGVDSLILCSASGELCVLRESKRFLSSDMQTIFPVTDIKLRPHNCNRGAPRHVLIRLTVNGVISLYTCLKLENTTNTVVFRRQSEVIHSQLRTSDLLRFQNSSYLVVAMPSRVVFYGCSEDLSLTECGHGEIEGDAVSMDVVGGEYLVIGTTTGKIDVREFAAAPRPEEPSPDRSPISNIYRQRQQQHQHQRVTLRMVPNRVGREPPLSSLIHNTSISAAAAFVRQIPTGTDRKDSAVKGMFATAWMDGRICMCRIENVTTPDGSIVVDWEAIQCFHTRYSFHSLEYFRVAGLRGETTESTPEDGRSRTLSALSDGGTTRGGWHSEDLCVGGTTHSHWAVTSAGQSPCAGNPMDTEGSIDRCSPTAQHPAPALVPSDDWVGRRSRQDRNVSEGEDMADIEYPDAHYVVATSVSGQSLFVSLLPPGQINEGESKQATHSTDNGSDSNREMLAFDSCHAFMSSLCSGVCAGSFHHISPTLTASLDKSADVVNDVTVTIPADRADSIIDKSEDDTAPPLIAKAQSWSRSQSLDSTLSTAGDAEEGVDVPAELTAARPPSAIEEGEGGGSVKGGNGDVSLAYLSAKGSVYIVCGVGRQLCDIGPPFLPRVPVATADVRAASRIVEIWPTFKKLLNKRDCEVGPTDDTQGASVENTLDIGGRLDALTGEDLIHHLMRMPVHNLVTLLHNVESIKAYMDT